MATSEPNETTEVLDAIGSAELSSDLEPAPVRTGGPSLAWRRNLGIAFQYAWLLVLALVILTPLLLTVRQALSPPFRWVNEGAPWHPANIAWKDRTFWSGGAASLVGRLIVVTFLFAWIQKAYSGVSTRRWLSEHRSAAALGVGGGLLATALLSTPVFGSFHAADGRTLGLFALAVAVVAVIEGAALWLVGRRPVGAALAGIATAVTVVGIPLVAYGPVVWTQSWAANDLGGGMYRSFVMAVLITVAQVLTSILAAYAFVYLEFPLKRLIFAVFMATLLLPLEVTLAANITTIQRMDWFNSYQGLVLPFAANAIGIFLIHQGFRGLPKDLRDAARLDGYGHLGFLFRVAVPLTRPVIAAFTVISALQAWNQYLWPRSVINDPTFATLQLQLRAVATADPSTANVAVAAALVAAVPVLILLIAFQRQIVRGLTAGAVK